MVTEVLPGEQYILFRSMRSTTGPSRLISRLSAELVLQTLIHTRTSFSPAFDTGNSYERVFLFLMLMRYADLPLERRTSESRALSVSGMAESLALPFETTRRHILRMEANGLVERANDGVRLGKPIMDTPAFNAYLRALHDRTVAHLVDLKRMSIILSPRPSQARYHAGEMLVAMLDMMIGLIEQGRRRFRTTLTAVVINTIVAANVRSITFDPKLAQRYARLDTIPPDELRVPIRVATIARAIHLPYSTVAREVDRLVAKGLVAETPEGLIVTRDVLSSGDLVENNRPALLRAVQAVQRLEGAGFAFEAPETCYLDGRPPLIPLG